MVDYSQSAEILSEMVQIGRTFRVAGQRSGGQSLTGTRYGFLQHLSFCDARLTELSHRLAVSVPVASRTIDSLALEGLVERRADPVDARASLISITKDGRARLAESESRAVLRFANALSEWSPADAERAIATLRTLNTHLTKVIDSPDSADACSDDSPTAAVTTTTHRNDRSEIRA